MSRDRHSIAADFSQLQREYKHMEQNRRQYTEDIERTIKRQQAAIEKLRRDNEALKAEIAMESRFTAKPPSAKHATTIADLHEKAAGYQQKLDVEKRTLSELGKQIRLMKEKILAQRKAMGGINASKENHAMVQKQIRILENRLDKALVKFNEALAENKRLREQIDNLRCERVVFDRIYRKLERELHEKKKEMASIIEASNAAYEARDTAQLEVAGIQHQNRKEQAEFEEKMAELGRVVEMERRAREREAEEMKRDLSSEEETALKKRATAGVWGAVTEKAHVQASMDKVQSYEDAFNKIKEATGIADIDQLVHTFIQNEDQNFSLFNYVNDQNNEIERLEEEIQALREEEMKYSRESGDDVTQHKQLLKDLEERLEATDTACEKYETKYSDASAAVSSLKVGIQDIFEKIGCRATALSEMFADGVVTEANMMQYLGIIEQRTNDILQAYAALRRADSPTPSITSELARTAGTAAVPPPSAFISILGSGPATPMGLDGISISPPALDDYSSDDEVEEEEEEAHPLTREELASRTLRGLHKKARPRRRSGAGGGGGSAGGGSGKGRSAVAY